MARSKVAAVKVSPATVLDGIQRACDLAELGACLAPQAACLIRGNVLPLPVPGMCSTPWQLEGALRALRQAGHSDLTCLQDRIFENDLGGWLSLCRKLRVPVRSHRDELDTVRIAYRPKVRLRLLHQLFPGGITVPEEYLNKNIVHLPTLRAHAHSGIAGAAHSALVGLLGSRSYLAPSSWHLALVDALAIQKEIHAGLFAVLDGTSVASATGTDRTRAPLLKNIVLVSGDPVAIDAVAAKLLGHDPLELQYLKLAQQDGLGIADPRDIELLGDDVTGESVSLASEPGASGPLRRALSQGQQILLRTRLADTIESGREFLRDHLSWPRHQRAVFETWKQQTEWGRLLASYEGRSMRPSM